MKTLFIQVAFYLIHLSVYQDAAKVNTGTKCILCGLPNDNSNVTIAIKAEFIELFTVPSNIEHEILVDIISRAFQINSAKSGRHCSEVIGVVGDLDSTTASIIHTLASRSNLNITLVAAVAPSTFLPVTNLALPHVLDMNPLVHYIEASISFTDQLIWTRIGLISDGSHYHEFATELFQTQLFKNYERSIVPYIIYADNSDFVYTLQKIKESKTQVIVISMDGNNACLLIEEAKKMDMRWPEYAWLFLDYKANFISTATCDMEGIIILSSNETTFPDTGSCNSSIDTQLMRMFSSLCNYSKVLYDSVMAVVLADSIEGIDITNMSFIGTTGLVKFRNGQRLINIDIVQIINGANSQTIASYNSELKKLEVHFDITASKFNNRPRYGESMIYNEQATSKIVPALLVFTLSITFISFILILFVLFRKEKEIKATSFTISLCMFLGCYIMLFNIPIILVVNIPHRVSGPFLPEYITCSAVAWLGIVGIPPSLILATILAKMIRVYAIFVRPYSFKKKLFSNYALFLYIILLISPNVLILTLWSSVDPLYTHEFEIETKSQLLILETCLSDRHTYVWVATLLVIYMITLNLAVIVVAFKTSKIRYKHFEDTKATNTFAFLAIFIILTTLLYFFFFTWLEVSVDSFIATDITLYVGNTTFALFCQIFLFAPKVLPPFQRWLSHNYLITV